MVYKVVAFLALGSGAGGEVLYQVADTVKQDQAVETEGVDGMVAVEEEKHGGVSLHEAFVGGGEPVWDLAECDFGVELHDIAGNSVAGGQVIPKRGEDVPDEEFEPTVVGPDVGYLQPKGSEGDSEGLVVLFC